MRSRGCKDRATTTPQCPCDSTGDHRTSMRRACFYPRVWTMFAGFARAHLLTKLVPMGSMLPLQGIVILL